MQTKIFLLYSETKSDVPQTVSSVALYTLGCAFYNIHLFTLNNLVTSCRDIEHKMKAYIGCCYVTVKLLVVSLNVLLGVRWIAKHSCSFLQDTYISNSKELASEET